MISTYHCPQCSALLQAAGVVTITTPEGGEEAPVFQCNTCVVMKRVFRDDPESEMKMALTFVVDAAGRVVDTGE